jgi:hypothetical protein
MHQEKPLSYSTGYWDETRGMAKEPRQRARELVEAKYRDGDDKAGTLTEC